jgi:hypothetical protein
MDSLMVAESRSSRETCPRLMRLGNGGMLRYADLCARKRQASMMARPWGLAGLSAEGLILSPLPRCDRDLLASGELISPDSLNLDRSAGRQQATQTTEDPPMTATQRIRLDSGLKTNCI